jgi:predicted  nucleic acid-binding Zn-ribbon protein
MAQDFEKLLKDVKEDVTRLNNEVAELRKRLARLEEERAEKAAESLESSF